ncbi:MAG: FAD-binding oxidoreductase [bacterium]
MDTTQTSEAVTPGRASHIDDTDIEQFASGLSGRLLGQQDAGYEEARKVWNGLIDKRPSLIVRCAGVADVIDAVRFARSQGLEISVRGGGHNVAGSAVCNDGLVIDLSEMRAVRVNPRRRTARAEAGARLGDVDRETQAFGLAAPLGLVSETGIAGLTLHGGVGWLTRRHGMSIDNLLSVDIVTADGELLRASADENKDLFWAVRGGGGNFGVVTSFQYRLHPVGPQVWFAAAMYPLEKAAGGMKLFREYMAKAPEDLGALAVFWSAPSGEEVPEAARGAPVLILMGCYSGPFDKGEEIIRPLREFDEPVLDLSGPRPFLQVQKFFDEDYPNGMLYYWKSIFIDELSEPAIEALAGHAAARPSSLNSLDVWALGGAMGRVGPQDTALAGRGSPFMLGIEGNWREPEQTEANIAWARKVFKDMHRFSGGGTYLNFSGFAEEGESLLRGAHGANYERLRAVKARYDPENLFRGNLNIRP